MPARGGSSARLALLLQRVAAAGQHPARARGAAAALGVATARDGAAGGARGGGATPSPPDDQGLPSSSSSSLRFAVACPQPPALFSSSSSSSSNIGAWRPAAEAASLSSAWHEGDGGVGVGVGAGDARGRRRRAMVGAWAAAWQQHHHNQPARAFSAAAAVVKEAPESSSAAASSPPIERPSRGRRGPDFGPAAAGTAAAAPSSQQPAPPPPPTPPKPAVPVGPPYKWRVSVVTGNVRGAGTHAPVTLQLVGSKGASPSVPVGGSDDGDSGLARATAVALELALERDIGQLRRVRVERAPSSTSGTGEGWFLDRVEVQGPAGEHLLLPCRAWFGASDCGDFVGALERNLIPVEEDDLGTEYGASFGAANGQNGAGGARGARWAEVVGSAPVDVRAAGVAFPHPEKVIKNQVRGVVARGFGYGGEDAFFFATGGATRASAAWAPRQRRSAAAPPDPRCTSAAAIVGGGGGAGGAGGDGAVAAPSVLPDPLPPPPPRPAFADPSSHHYDPDQVHGEEPQFEIPQLSAGAGPALSDAGHAAHAAAPANGPAAANNSSPSSSNSAPAAAPPASAGAGPAAVFGMGVSDGVYMWKEVGIDSGAMSRTLMETASHMVQAGCEDVLRVLQVAARHVESEGVAGSATACLVTVNKAAARLQAATLGDSGFFVLSPAPEAAVSARPASSSSSSSSSSPPRPALGQAYRPPLPPSSRASFPQQQEQHLKEQQEKAAAAVPGEARLRVRYRSPQLEREFGCPYQLGHHSGAQAPEDADLVALPVSPGDVIVMGTDGLLDNLSEAEILREVQLEAAAALAAAARAGKGGGGKAAVGRRHGAAAASSHLASPHQHQHQGVHHHPTHHHEVGGGKVAAAHAAAAAGGGGAAPVPSPPALPPSALISPSSLAHRLARLAFEASVDRSRSTPYSRAATEAFDMVYSGGKPDDITVVVAVVGPPPAAGASA